MRVHHGGGERRGIVRILHVMSAVGIVVVEVKQKMEEKKNLRGLALQGSQFGTQKK